MKNGSYNSESIKRLDPLSAIRNRNDLYTGGNDDSSQLAIEIITNAVDEHLAGNCTHINVTYVKDTNVITVEDDGQGIIPSLYQDDGRTILEMVYADLNVSGKFDKGKDAVYSVSTGAFGIGASLANYLSHWLEAMTFRGDKYELVRFEEGLFVSRQEGTSPMPNHGVTVSFQPSEEFFTDARPNMSLLKKKIEGICCLCPGLTVAINIVDHGKTTTYDIYKNGIVDLISDNVDNVGNIFTFKHVDKEDSSRMLNLAYGLKEDGKESVVVGYANYGPIESGTAFQVIKTQLAKDLTEWGHAQAVLKPKETLNVSSIQDDMCLAFNLTSNNIRYDSQTKVRMSSTADNQFMRDTVSLYFKQWLNDNPNTAKDIVEKAILSKRASEMAKKARDAVKNKGAKKDAVFKMPTTLVDASSKKRADCELWVVEGKSAQGGMVFARDSKTQAIYGVRGMMLNVLKTAPENIMKNQEINNLVIALGLDVDMKTGKMVYNPKKLRYGKIIACGDGDAPGKAICNLMFNILWYMCPELFFNGHVYMAIPPLFRVTTTKNEYVYCDGQKELEQAKKKYKVKAINRAKGLSEQSSEELELTLLNPATRKIVEINVNVADRATFGDLMTDLYGKAVEPRVEYIMKHSEETEYDCE